jgi:hypothetical protein
LVVSDVATYDGGLSEPEKAAEAAAEDGSVEAEGLIEDAPAVTVDETLAVVAFAEAESDANLVESDDGDFRIYGR